MQFLYFITTVFYQEIYEKLAMELESSVQKNQNIVMKGKMKRLKEIQEQISNG